MAFTENWSDILTTQVDADSPINETLMQSIRSDLIHIKEALGQNYILAPDHNHDGVNSAYMGSVADGAITQPKIASGAVGQGELKTATASHSRSGQQGNHVSVALTGGTYAWWTASASEGSYSYASWVFAGNADYPGGTLGFKQIASGWTSISVDERYIQASPPYKISGNTWNHFVYLMINNVGEIIGWSEALDPTWAYNGSVWIPDKNAAERIVSAPHPFPEYWKRNPAVDGLEICLLDIRHIDFDAMKVTAARNNRRAVPELLRTNNIGEVLSVSTVAVDGLGPAMKFRGVK